MPITEADRAVVAHILIDQEVAGAEGAEALIVVAVVRTEVRDRRIASLEENARDLLEPEPDLTILHHIVVARA